MLKKIFLILFIVNVFIVTVVLMNDAESKIINGKVYEAYGLLNKDSVYNENIEYRMNNWSVGGGILMIETVIAPIYFFGFNMYEPVGLKQNN